MEAKKMDELVEVLGIISLIVIVFTVFSGLAMKYKRNQLFKIHRFAGYVALALAICHGILAIFS
jgi:DMSO/TMAO reductase YedYZ heme-binding membrane subunit